MISGSEDITIYKVREKGKLIIDSAGDGIYRNV